MHDFARNRSLWQRSQLTADRGGRIEHRIYFWTITAILYFLAISPTAAQSKLTLSGYVKDLYSIVDINRAGTLTDNLLHNRLNLDWYPHENWSFSAALRTRLFYGDQVTNPFFVPLIEVAANDVVDLSLSAKLGDRGYLYSYLDRLYVDYTKEDWQVRVGRQRINWGIHTVWNPNDLFNTFSFTDFDYEERPGSDAVSIRYYTGSLSSVEVAVKAFDHIDELIAAMLWKTHKWEYDFQFLGGVRERFVVGGGGWAGNLGNWGFKGEWTVFVPFDQDQESSVSASIGWDNVFENGIFFGFSGLFNSLGSSSGRLQDIFLFDLSPRNLYPFRWTVYTNVGKQLHPLLLANLTMVYSPVKSHPFFVSPALTWSALTNLDVDAVGQIAFASESGKYRSIVNAWYLRVKWSF